MTERDALGRVGRTDLVCWVAAVLAVLGIALARGLAGETRYGVNPVWPAVGVGTAALVLVERRRLPLAVLGLGAYVLLSALAVGSPLFEAAMVALAGLGASGLATLVLRRAGVRRIDGARASGVLVAAAATGGGAVGLSGMALNLATGEDIRMALVAGMACSAAIVIWLPLLLGRANAVVEARPRPSPLEVVAQVGVLAVSSALAVAVAHEALRALGGIGVLIGIGWAAVRFGLRITSAQLSALSLLGAAVWIVGAPLLPPSVLLSDDSPGDVELTWAIGVFVMGAALLALLLSAMADQQRLLTRAVRTQQSQAEVVSSGAAGVGRIVTSPLAEGASPRVVEVNGVAARMLGAPAEEVLGTELAEWLDPGDEVARSWRLATWDGEALALRTGHSVQVAAAIHVSGGGIAASLSLTRPRSADEPGIVTVIDRAVVEEADDLYLVCDLAGRVTDANSAARRLLDLAGDDGPGPAFWDVAVVDGERAQVRQAWGDPMRDGLPAPRELVARTGTESRRIRWTWSLLGDPAAPDGVLAVGEDVTDDNLQSDLMRLILDSTTSTVILLTDIEGRVTVCNDGAERILGRPQTSLVGRPIDSALAPVDVAGDARSALESVCDLSAPTPGGERWRVIADDDLPAVLPTVLRADVARLRNGAGRQIGYVLVGHDATSEERITAELAQAVEAARASRERLERSKESQARFVSTASHELRTPVTNIVGRVDLLREGAFGELDAAQLRAVDAIARGTTRLTELVNDLVMLNEIDSLDREGFVPTDLSEVVRAAARAESARRGEGREIEERIESGVGVLADPMLLRASVAQLVRNAVTFSEPGAPVRVRLRAIDGQAELSVEDEGVGIPEAEQGQIFDRFFRGSAAHLLAAPGSGIGLAIAASVAQVSQGSLSVASEPGVGSRFVLRLPLRDPAR